MAPRSLAFLGLLGVLAAPPAPAGARQAPAFAGRFDSALGRVEVKVDGANVVGTLLEPARGSPFRAGEEVLRGTVLDDSVNRARGRPLTLELDAFRDKLVVIGGTAVGLNAQGERLVGFLHVPQDAHTSVVGDRYVQAERHQGTREVVINRSVLERHLGTMRTLLSDLDYSTKRLGRVADEITTQIDMSPMFGLASREAHDQMFDPFRLAHNIVPVNTHLAAGRQVQRAVAARLQRGLCAG